MKRFFRLGFACALTVFLSGIVSDAKANGPVFKVTTIEGFVTPTGNNFASWGRVNRQGQIAGNSTNYPDNTNRAFRWTDLDGDFHTNTSDEIIDLGSLGTGANIESYTNHYPFPGLAYPVSQENSRGGINSNGDVAGVTHVEGPAFHAFRWTDSDGAGPSQTGTMIDLGVFSGGRGSYSDGISDQGEVVGTSEKEVATSEYNLHAFYWRDNNGNSVSDPGEMVDLHLPGIASPNHTSHGAAINNNIMVLNSNNQPTTQVLVDAFLVDPANPSNTDPNYSGFVWSDLNNDQVVDVLTEVSKLPIGNDWTDSAPKDINNQGEVVGWGNVMEGRAMKWSSSGTSYPGYFDLGTLLPYPTGGFSEAWGINNSMANDFIVGWSNFENTAGHIKDWDAFLYTTLTTLPKPAGTKPADVNGGQMVDLNAPELITDSANWQLYEARDISDSMQIVAEAYYQYAPNMWEYRNVLLTPYPGDANLDGIVDGKDYLVWVGNFGKMNATFTEGDFNGDGVTDGLDYIIWATNNGGSWASSAVVIPEPGGIVIFIMTLSLMASSRWRPRQARLGPRHRTMHLRSTLR